MSAVFKAEWNEADHPRAPAGTSEGGQFVGDKVSIEDLQKEAKKRLANREQAFGGSEVLHELTSPYRQNPEALDEIQSVASKSSFDSTVKALDSQMAWQSGWAALKPEWEAAQRAGGNGQMSKTAKEEMNNPGWKYKEPLSESDHKAFAARREWMQQKFRELHGEEIEVYRGVKGAYAKKLPESGEVDLPGYALSSWTVDEFDAHEFAGSKGRVLRTKIKASDIWMLPRVGIESALKIADARNEVVILNTSKTRKAEVVR